MVSVGPYKLSDTLGVGTFGKVKLALHTPTCNDVAIKIINRKKMESMNMHEKIRREIKILPFLKHPHVIGLYEVIDTPSDIFMVLEFVEGGELFEYIVYKHRLHENEARHFFQQIVSGVEYCHKNMLAHRDLKPENLLLDAKLEKLLLDYRRVNIKIADFGLSNIMKDGEFLKTSCGSPNYASPEVVSGRTYVGPEVDVWSCGVVLYALLCGHLPFDDENIPTLFKKIKNGNFTLPGHLPPEAKDLIVQILYVDPTRRITFAQTRKHVWFQKNLPAYLSGDLQKQSLEKGPLNPEILKSLEAKGYLNISSKENLTPDELVAYHIMANRALQEESFLSARPQDRPKNTEPSFYQDSGEDGESDDLLALAMAFDKEDCAPKYKLPPTNAPTLERSVLAASPSLPAENWQLALEVVMEAAHLVHEVLRTLQDLGFEWHSVNTWRFKARPTQQGMQWRIVLIVQVYKVAPGRYVVDVMVSSGPSLPAMHAALHLLRRLADNEAVAPRVVSKAILGQNGPHQPFASNRVPPTSN